MVLIRQLRKNGIKMDKRGQMSSKHSKPARGLAGYVGIALPEQRGAGQYFSFDIHNVARIRTGETGDPAIG